jgi:hypothetical protein
MTQEELDALMDGGIDSTQEEDIADETMEDGSSDNAMEAKSDTDKKEEEKEGFRVNSSTHWPPPPPDDDHKVVHQLDDVTKESEEKASEIFDIIENISNNLMDKEQTLHSCTTILENNIKLFTSLQSKFPDIKTFQKAKDENESALLSAQEMSLLLQESGDSLMNVMDIMQYQDIHRQKIERVINVMRALSNYMNALFAGKIDDDKRVSSAVHIPGDSTTEDVVNADDIEALLAQFGTNG